MKRRYTNIKPYLLLFALLILLLSAPSQPAELLRSGAVALMRPLWSSLAASHQSLPEGEGLQLAEENEALKRELEKLKELFQQELRLLSQMAVQLPGTAASLEKHQHSFAHLLVPELEALPARVIFRSPNSWSSTLWIDLGSDNASHIARNSPVVVGRALVGVVDYVGRRQSRVRLITDAGIAPAVRVARGQPKYQQLFESLLQFQGNIAANPSLFADAKEKNRWLQRLEALKKKIPMAGEGWLLAKGEIHGSSEPLWRSKGQKLQGIGFNYDFADDEGPARDLRSGEPLNVPSGFSPVPLIALDDLLVTSGLDGIFPSGLHVGTVAAVAPLKEGDYTYSIEALPAAGNFDELSLLFVLAPLGYDAGDQPPIIGR